MDCRELMRGQSGKLPRDRVDESATVVMVQFIWVPHGAQRRKNEITLGQRNRDESCF
jgi:hypothetical protein